jgi:t-SNARE complex subunit (syntaxin)
MKTKQILKLEEQTLMDLYILSIKQKDVEKLKNELRTIEKDMFDILAKLAYSINEIIEKKEMLALKEIIDKHKFLQLVEDSKKALESTDRDFIESVEKRVRLFDADLTKFSQLYGIHDYRTIEDLEDIEEKLKFEYDYRIKNPLSAILIILIWNSRILYNSLSSRAVWLSYKKP